MILEIYLQAAVCEAAQLNVQLFLLALYVWPMAIWGAFILDY